MKKLFIFLVSMVLIIGIVVSAFVFYFLKTFDANKIVSIASAEFEKEYGYKIVASNAYFDIKQGLAVDGVKLIDLSNNREVFTSEKFFLSYEPALLVREKKLKISRISFFKAFTTYENLLNFLSRFRPESATTSLIKIEISTISFDDSIIEYRNKKVSIDGNIEFLKNKVLYKLKAFYKDTAVDFNGNFDEAKLSMKNFNLEEWLDTKFPLYVENTYFVFRRDSKLYQLNLTSFNGRYEDRTLSVSKPFSLIISNNMSAFFFENVELTYNGENNFFIKKAVYLNNKDFYLEVSKSDFNLNEFIKDVNGRIEGSFLFDMKKEIPIIGTLKVKSLNYQKVTNFNGELELTEENFDLKGQGYFCGVNFSVDANSRDIGKGNLYLNLNIPVLEIENFLKEFKGTFSSDLSGRNPFNSATFNINIEKLIYKELHFKNVLFSGDLNSERINILNASAEIFNGKITSSGFIEGGILNLKLNYDRGKLNEFSDLIFKDDRKLYGTISLESRLLMKPFVFSSIDGTIKGFVNYGELENIFIQKKLNEFLSDIPLDHVYFDRINFDFILRNSKLKINNLEFKSTKINSTIKGEYSISEDLLSFTIFLSFSKSYLKDLPNIAGLLIKGRNRENWVDFSLFAEGSSKNVKFSFLEIQ